MLMRYSLCLFLLIVRWLLAADAAEPVAVLVGRVTDEKGTPLEGVTVQVAHSGPRGFWMSGVRPKYSTDAVGIFTVPFNRPEDPMDLWFDKPGFAPVFLFDLLPGPEELVVVMNGGIVIRGTVDRLVDGHLEPLMDAAVELRLPSDDLWYQQRSFTDTEGLYSFRVSPPPKDRKWQVVFAGVTRELIVAGDPVVGPDFVVTVQERKPEAIEADAKRLHEIGLAVQKYVKEQGGHYPRRLLDLVEKNCLEDPGVLVSRHGRGQTAPLVGFESIFEKAPRLLTVQDLPLEDPDDPIPMVWCGVAHPDGQRSVLFSMIPGGISGGTRLASTTRKGFDHMMERLKQTLEGLK